MEERRRFSLGDEAFDRSFSVGEGLGPVFNHVSCQGCHPGDGRGALESVVRKFSVEGGEAYHLGGPVLQTQAIPGVVPESLPEGAVVSGRLPPPVFGMGLIEAIPVEVILAAADPEDRDGDGISGRAHWVSAPAFVPVTEVGGGGGQQLGRFGRKAAVASLLHQVADAYLQDMGITTDFFPQEVALHHLDEVADPELPASEVVVATAYVRFLSPPRRGEESAEGAHGRGLFRELGCEGCHTPTMVTGQHQSPALSGVEVHLYSDLLLHDLGAGLSDGRADQDAQPQEWRTAPLWGLRLADAPLPSPARYLHDGRAASLHEAITLHGGEAQRARDAYVARTMADQAALIAFLKTL
jgi:CxxC motif-containing protein (DUF1111 family)